MFNYTGFTTDTAFVPPRYYYLLSPYCDTLFSPASSCILAWWLSLHLHPTKTRQNQSAQNRTPRNRKCFCRHYYSTKFQFIDDSRRQNVFARRTACHSRDESLGIQGSKGMGSLFKLNSEKKKKTSFAVSFGISSANHHSSSDSRMSPQLQRVAAIRGRDGRPFKIRSFTPVSTLVQDLT